MSNMRGPPIFATSTVVLPNFEGEAGRSTETCRALHTYRLLIIFLWGNMRKVLLVWTLPGLAVRGSLLLEKEQNNRPLPEGSPAYKQGSSTTGAQAGILKDPDP